MWQAWQSTAETGTLGFIGNIGWPELLVLALIGLLIFGKRLPEVGKSIGRGIVEFKRGLSGIEEDLDQADKQPPEIEQHRSEQVDTDQPPQSEQTASSQQEPDRARSSA